jgi:hypothetical protein
MPQLGQFGQSPPLHSATQLAVAMTLNEVAITFGRARQIIDPITGGPAPNAALEWMFTVTIPLPAAAALREALMTATRTYEEKFGKIPHDPPVEGGI